MKIKSIPRNVLEDIIKTSFCWSDAIRKSGKTPHGASFQFFQARVRNLGIDTSHFLGKAAHAGPRQTGSSKKKHWSEVLVKGKTLQRERSRLLRRVYAEYCDDKNIPIQCECGNSGEWRGKSLRLQVNHKDGIRSNNIPDNLEWVCPNCHDIKTIY